jgi:pimeloyl-ACP methyl ester carboxylesterase
LLAGRPPDACGDSASVPGAVGSNRVGVAKVTVPVLLALGDHDSLFPPPAGDDQKALFTGTKDIRLVTLPHTGNATSLERTAPAFRATVDGWLRANGF